MELHAQTVHTDRQGPGRVLPSPRRRPYPYPYPCHGAFGSQSMAGIGLPSGTLPRRVVMSMSVSKIMSVSMIMSMIMSVSMSVRSGGVSRIPAKARRGQARHDTTRRTPGDPPRTHLAIW